MKKTIFPVSVILAAALAHCAVAQAQTYSLPEEWAGVKLGEKTNNPLEVGGKPMWKAVNIWPDSVTDPENYKELVWGGKQWVSPNPEEQSYGGQPSIQPGEYTVDIGNRSGWGDSTSSKLGALIFIAPKTGAYKVKGSYMVDTWEGDQANAEVSVRMIDRAKGLTNKVTDLESGERRVWMPMEFEVTLEEGQELAFITTFRAMHVASGLSLRELELTVAPAKP